MSEKVNLKNVLKFAGVYVACAIGSGFATGQEIMQFFTAQGMMSVAGAIITMALFGWAGGKVMSDAKKLDLRDSSMISRYYFGNRFGKVFELLFKVFLFGVFVIMLAGAGATLSEHFGLNPLFGRIIMVALAGLSVILSLNKLADILGSLGIVIIILAVGIGLFSMIRNLGSISDASAVIASHEMTKTSGGWLLSSILYPGFNIIVCLFFSAGVGSQANSGKEGFLGGLLGGVLFGLAVLIMNLGIMANIQDVWNAEIPTLILAHAISPVLATVFSIIIVCGIYTTAVPMLWSAASIFGKQGSVKYVIAVVLLCAVAFTLSLTDFKVLVNTIYPFSGYAGIILMAIMLGHALFDRRDLHEVGMRINLESVSYKPVSSDRKSRESRVTE